MAKISRQEARETLFALLFETEFHIGEDPHAVYSLACNERLIPDDKYIKENFFGVLSRCEVLDKIIGNYAKGWKADRISMVSRNIIRIAVYEMLFVEDIPANVSISQAVELSIKYGEDKAKQFVNGILSGLNKDIQAKGIDGVIASVADKKEEDASSNESEASENGDA